MKRSMKKLGVFVIIAAIAIFISTATATAGDKDPKKTIKGDYAFTGEGFCISSPSGFNPNLTPMDGWFFQSFNVQGVWTFNHDGTGSRQGRSVIVTLISPPVSPPSASSMDFQASFTYTIGPDDTITTQLSSPLTGQMLTGPRTGQTFTIDQIVLTGMISKDNKSLTIATDEPQIETVTFSDGFVEHRICHRARVLLRLE